MADKPKKESEALAAAAGDKGAAKTPGAKGGAMGTLLAKTPIILGGVMLIEAVVLFAGFKFVGGGTPKTVQGADLVKDATGGAEGAEAGKAPEAKKRLSEINLVDFKALNKLGGHSFLYDVSIDVTTKAEFEDRVKENIKENDALIKDRVRTIIAELDPEKLGGASEPGLETLKRQIKFQLDQMWGDGLVDEVLVSRCIPIRTDY
jgi:flagellar basal body-associated protein FliL